MGEPTAVPISFRVSDLIARHPGGISQAELARRAGLSNTAINDIVHNRTARVSLSTLEALSRALGVTPCDLIAWDDTSPDQKQGGARKARTKAAGA